MTDWPIVSGKTICPLFLQVRLTLVTTKGFLDVHCIWSQIKGNVIFLHDENVLWSRGFSYPISRHFWPSFILFKEMESACLTWSTKHFWTPLKLSLKDLPQSLDPLTTTLPLNSPRRGTTKEIPGPKKLMHLINFRLDSCSFFD